MQRQRRVARWLERTSSAPHLDRPDARQLLPLCELERAHARSVPPLGQCTELLLAVLLERRPLADLLRPRGRTRRRRSRARRGAGGRKGERRAGEVHAVEREAQDHEEEGEPRQVDVGRAGGVAQCVEGVELGAEAAGGDSAGQGRVAVNASTDYCGDARGSVEVVEEPVDAAEIAIDEERRRLPPGQRPHDALDLCRARRFDLLTCRVKVDEEVRLERRGGCGAGSGRDDARQGFGELEWGSAEANGRAGSSVAAGAACRGGSVRERRARRQEGGLG